MDYRYQLITRKFPRGKFWKGHGSVFIMMRFFRDFKQLILVTVWYIMVAVCFGLKRPFWWWWRSAKPNVVLLFKINFGSKLSTTLSTDGKRASLLRRPCWIRTNELQASACRIVAYASSSFRPSSFCDWISNFRKFLREEPVIASLASHPTCFRQRRLHPIVWPWSSVECLQRYDLVRANQRRDRLVGAKGGGRSWRWRKTPALCCSQLARTRSFPSILKFPKQSLQLSLTSMFTIFQHLHHDS